MAVKVDKCKESENVCNRENKTWAYFDFEDMGGNKEYIWFINENVHNTRKKATPGSRQKVTDRLKF